MYRKRVANLIILGHREIFANYTITSVNQNKIYIFHVMVACSHTNLKIKYKNESILYIY